MSRRLNFTGRKKINRADALIRLARSGTDLTFDADLRLADYKFDRIHPPPRVYVEAYRTVSMLWKRFDFGRVGTLQPPRDRTLNEFSVPEGILFTVKVSAEGDALGKLVAEADSIRPRLPDETDDRIRPLIDHKPSDELGDELWRVAFGGDRPLLLVNRRVPMGFEQFLRDPAYRAVFAPAVMRQVLTRILIIEPDLGDEDDEEDWRVRWVRFAEGLPGVDECPGTVDDGTLRDSVEDWVDRAVTAFCSRSGLFDRFVQVGQQPEGKP